MSKGTILGIVWLALVAFAAWYTYKHFRPGILK